MKGHSKTGILADAATIHECVVGRKTPLGGALSERPGYSSASGARAETLHSRRHPVSLTERPRERQQRSARPRQESKRLLSSQSLHTEEFPVLDGHRQILGATRCTRRCREVRPR